MPEGLNVKTDLLQIEDLHAFYGESHVLHGVNLTVRRGEILAEGPYETVSRNPQVMEAYMGTGHA